jgi:predicted GTPase
MPTKVLIMGAAGKDFHVFNTVYRKNEEARVVAFTATQIPGIEERTYPALLAGPLYPDGVPIEPEEDLEELIRAHSVDTVVFAYSDVSYDYVQTRQERAESAGARFETAPTPQVMLKSSKPTIAVCAVRTGCGKSQTSRYIVTLLRELGRKAVAIRHPMPYGDLTKQRVQRFATLEDMKRHHCTIEEMEEYEPYIKNGLVVYAGVDYEAILREAETEAEVILWDGGNNDIPFVKPDLHITLVDPHRPGHETRYYPGRENLELAHVVLFNKMDSADPENVKRVEANVEKHNPRAKRVYCNSLVTVDRPQLLEGARVLAVEDGPTLTHGEMQYGAAVLAARRFGAREIVDPRPYVVGTLTETFRQYPDIGPLLPAMGYGTAQIKDLQETINRCECDVVAIGTPIDLDRVIEIQKPHVRVRYELEEVSGPKLIDLIQEAIGR